MDPAPPHEVDCADGSRHDVIVLAAIDVVLPSALLVRQPQMCRLVAEDAALVFERQQWRGRRPQWWRLGRRFEWHHDGRALDRRRAELATFVAAYRADRATPRPAQNG